MFSKTGGVTEEWLEMEEVQGSKMRRLMQTHVVKELNKDKSWIWFVRLSSVINIKNANNVIIPEVCLCPCVCLHVHSHLTCMIMKKPKNPDDVSTCLLTLLLIVRCGCNVVTGALTPGSVLTDQRQSRQHKNDIYSDIFVFSHMSNL